MHNLLHPFSLIDLFDINLLIMQFTVIFERQEMQLN